MAESYAAGRQRIREINADCERRDFILKLGKCASEKGIQLTDIEWDFIIRIEHEHNKEVPDIHTGDRNIIDSLRRKYEGILKL
jgi:hypothetical protein